MTTNEAKLILIIFDEQTQQCLKAKAERELTKIALCTIIANDKNK